jgi:gamma-glutamyltranspeptidase/glutathione hydrolase
MEHRNRDYKAGLTTPVCVHAMVATCARIPGLTAFSGGDTVSAMNSFLRAGLRLAALVATFTSTLFAQVDRITGRSFATRSEVFAQNGMVCTSQPLATQIGLDVLKAGGTAVDAAIAANAALGLMEPTGCGIGGDLFAIVYDAKTKKLHGLNASGRSPRGLSLEQLQAELKKLDVKTIPQRGLLPISVPGAVDGWFQLHDKFGKLPMAEVLAPAIRYARDGFPVSEVIAYYWDRGVELAKTQPGGFMATFAPGGRAPRKGEIF